MQNRGQLLARAGAVCFGLSTLLPILASTVLWGRLPGWLGAVDVALAGLVLGIGVYLNWLTRDNVTAEAIQASYHFYRGLGIVPLGLVAIYMVLSPEVAWDVLLIGLGWRAWFLVYVYPAWWTSLTAGGPTTGPIDF